LQWPMISDCACRKHSNRVAYSYLRFPA
jgi:hypothetical protein